MIDDFWDSPRYEAWVDFMYQMKRDGYAEQWSFELDRCPEPSSPVVLAANRMAVLAEVRWSHSATVMGFYANLWDQPPTRSQLRRWGLPLTTRRGSTTIRRKVAP